MPYAACLYLTQALSHTDRLKLDNGMCAESNPPFVFATFSFGSLPGPGTGPAALFGLSPCGSACFIPYMETSGYAIIVLHVGFFSAPLPVVSDYPSPDHTPVWREEFPLPWQRSRFSSHGSCCYVPNFCLTDSKNRNDAVCACGMNTTVLGQTSDNWRDFNIL